MLLRQALEQTRAGIPTPVQFNYRLVVLDQIDEVSAMVQKDVFDIHLTLSTMAQPSDHSFAALPGKSGQVSRTARLRPLSPEGRHHE
jgi:hypothetical protein